MPNKTLRQIRSIKKRRSAAEGKKVLIKKRRLLVVLLGIPLVSLVVGALGVFGVFAYVDSLIPENLVLETPSQSTFIYDRNGAFLYEIHGDERRTNIELSAMPQVVIDSTLALEDKDFYSHPGIAFTGMIRAALLNLQTDATTGASTITQQLVKNKFLTDEKSFERKLKEALYAIRIEQKYSKDEILQAYLNQINYGKQAYGIQAAAERYFNKNAVDLNLAEAAALVGIPQLPAYNNLFSGYTRNLENELFVNLDAPEGWLHEQYLRFSRDEGESKVMDRWRQRQIKTLHLMMVQGTITEAEALAALDYPINPTVPYEAINAPHFVLYVQALLDEKYGEERIRTGGLKVYTTLDLGLQKEVERIAADQINSIRDRYNAHNAAVVVADPTTGQILAHVGSVNYFDASNDGNVDVANSTSRQPGSSFKPFVYAAALEKGANSETMVLDAEMDFGGNYVPQNYDLREHGPVSLRNALANSYNIPAVKIAGYVGVEGVIDFARRLGITTLNSADNYGLSIGLGSPAAKLYDMVTAYATFANRGKRLPVSTIMRITNNEGKVIEEFAQPEGEQVIDPGIAYIIADILSDNQARTAAFGWNTPLRVSRQAAVKTGTTNDVIDNWTMGFTPNLVVGTWVGNNNSKSMCCGASGVTGAAPIWHDVIEAAFERYPATDWYAMPDSVAWVTVDEFSGGLPGEFTGDSTQGALIMKSNIPKTAKDDMRKRLVVDTQNGLLANPITPAELRVERTYYAMKPLLPEGDSMVGRWQNAINQWAERFTSAELGYNPYVPPTEVSPSYYNAANAPQVVITNLTGGQTLTTGNFDVKATASSPFPIQSVEFYLGSKLIGQTAGTQAEYTKPYVVEDGAYSIVVKAKDEKGAVGEAHVGVTVNSTLSIDISSPKNMAYVPSPFTVVTVLNAPAGIKKVIYALDGQEVKSVNEPTPSAKLIAADGTYVLLVTATDNNGKTASDSLTLTVDSAAPTAFSLSGDCSIQLTDSCDISLSPVDSESGIAVVELFMKAPEQSNTSKVSSFSKSPTSYRFVPTNAGTYTFYAIAFDRAGNTRQSSTYTATVVK